MYSITVGFSPTLYCWLMLLPSGNPFKCHEEVLYSQPMIPPKRFDIFHLDWGMLKRSRCCVQMFLETNKWVGETLWEQSIYRVKLEIRTPEFRICWVSGSAEVETQQGM